MHFFLAEGATINKVETRTRKYSHDVQSADRKTDHHTPRRFQGRLPQLVIGVACW